MDAGEKRTGTIPKCSVKVEGVKQQELIAVTAMRIEGEADRIRLDRHSARVLTNLVRDGKLDWQVPEDGKYGLFFFLDAWNGSDGRPFREYILYCQLFGRGWSKGAGRILGSECVYDRGGKIYPGKWTWDDVYGFFGVDYIWKGRSTLGI